MSAIFLLMAVLAGGPSGLWIRVPSRLAALQQNSPNTPAITKAEWDGSVVRLAWLAPKQDVAVAFVVQRWNDGMTNKFTVNPLALSQTGRVGEPLVTYYWTDDYGQCNTPFTYRIKTKLASSDSGWSAPMMATATVGEKPKE